MISYSFSFFIFFFLLHEMCGILVPRTRNLPPVVVAWSLNHWTAREVPGSDFIQARKSRYCHEGTVKGNSDDSSERKEERCRESFHLLSEYK